MRPVPEGVREEEEALVGELGEDEGAVPDERLRFAPRVVKDPHAVTRPWKQRRLGEKIGDVRPGVADTQLDTGISFVVPFAAYHERTKAGTPSGGSSAKRPKRASASRSSRARGSSSPS